MVNGSRPIQVKVCKNILPAVIEFVAENVAWLYVAMCYTVIPKILQASTCVIDIQTTSTVFYNAMQCNAYSVAILFVRPFVGMLK